MLGCRFGIYGDQAGQSLDIAAGPNVTADFANLLARRAIFRNFVAAETCVNAHIQSNDYVGNFQETLSIIQNKAKKLRPYHLARRHGRGHITQEHDDSERCEYALCSCCT